MTTYFYQATDTAGQIIEGDIEAPDYRVAVQKVRSLNYFPIKVTAGKPDTSFLQKMECSHFSGIFLFKGFFL